MECERKNNYRADKTVSGKKGFSVKVQFEASEDLLGPDDMEVDLRRILKEARDDTNEIFLKLSASKDLSFLVAEWSRWSKYKKAPLRRDSSASLQEMDGGKQAWDSFRNRW